MPRQVVPAHHARHALTTLLAAPPTMPDMHQPWHHAVCVYKVRRNGENVADLMKEIILSNKAVSDSVDGMVRAAPCPLPMPFLR